MNKRDFHEHLVGTRDKKAALTKYQEEQVKRAVKASKKPLMKVDKPVKCRLN